MTVSDGAVSPARSDAEAVAFVQQYEADPVPALAQIRRFMTGENLPGALLQALGKMGRSDIVVAATETLVFDERTPEVIIIERARALLHSGASSDGVALLERMAKERRRDYGYQLAAGRIVADARFLQPALQFYKAAFAIKPTEHAAERVFACLMAMENYPSAAESAAAILRGGSPRAGLANDFAFLLQRLKPGDIDPEITDAMAAAYGGESAIRISLLPHLIPSSAPDTIFTILDQEIASAGNWDDAAILDVISRFERRGEIEHLFRMEKEFGGVSDAIRDACRQALEKVPTVELTQFMMPRLPRAARSGPYVNAVKQFEQSADAGCAIEMLNLMPSAVGSELFPAFYAREKLRIGALVEHVLRSIGHHENAVETVANFVAACVPAPIRAFFDTAAARDLAQAIVAARRLSSAEEGSKIGRFREGYFASYLERRANLNLETLGDFELCEAAINYFSIVSRQRDCAAIPLGSAGATRLKRTALSLRAGDNLDVLGTVQMLRSRAEVTLDRSDGFNKYCTWYLTQLIPQAHLPPDAMAGQVINHLGQDTWKNDGSGLSISRFLKALWANSKEYRQQFDLRNIVDRHLFVLRILARDLPENSQYLPLVSSVFPNAGTVTILSRLVEEMGRRDNADLRRVATDAMDVSSGTAILRAIRGPIEAPVRIAANTEPDVLLIGYASKDSGLGRNLGMLEAGLVGAGATVTVQDFDASADEVNRALKLWYSNTRGCPIVVFAVNAQDLADFFVKDRDGILMTCYVVGFFLWELSRIPRVQQLGVALVDEIWAPTRYVADIYAHLARASVVGKGLFRGDEARARVEGPRDKNLPFSFVTVFDFDSSIERKNPLAAVLAFQRAFRGREEVELVIKGSNINPLHWSNADGHWEKLVEACRGDSRIKLVTRRYSDTEMTNLLRNADCVVSLHRSEGFGYLISDAIAFGRPVIATDYSGNVDFCDPDMVFGVPYRLVPAPVWAARWRCDDAQWAEPDVDAAAAQMSKVYGNYGYALETAERARQAIMQKFSFAAFAAALKARIDDIVRGDHTSVEDRTVR